MCVCQENGYKYVTLFAVPDDDDDEELLALEADSVNDDAGLPGERQVCSFMIISIPMYISYVFEQTHSITELAEHVETRRTHTNANGKESTRSIGIQRCAIRWVV